MSFLPHHLNAGPAAERLANPNLTKMTKNALWPGAGISALTVLERDDLRNFAKG
jgi:hypothetical protein